MMVAAGRYMSIMRTNLRFLKSTSNYKEVKLYSLDKN
jgi:hypothetical protein